MVDWAGSFSGEHPRCIQTLAVKTKDRGLMSMPSSTHLCVCVNSQDHTGVWELPSKVALQLGSSGSRVRPSSEQQTARQTLGMEQPPVRTNLRVREHGLEAHWSASLLETCEDHSSAESKKKSSMSSHSPSTWSMIDVNAVC